MLLSLSKSQYQTKLKIHENTTHLFDYEGLSAVATHVAKHEYNPEAARAAILEVREFLSKYLK